MLEKKNFYHNVLINLPDDYLTGQDAGELSKLKYGLYSVGWCGCEMIAVYNAARDLGVKTTLPRVCYEMYPKSSIMMGFFGSNVCALGKFFDARNIDYSSTWDYNTFFNELPHCQCGILSFWNHRRIFSSLHTVMVKYIDGKIVVFNKSNKRTEPVPTENRHGVTSEKLFIKGYLFEKGAKE